MAVVDPGDDGIRRYVVRHYRYDPQRRERRHVVVAAFDNRREFEACLRSVAAEIDRRRVAGEPVDPREHASGTVREAGADRRAADGHLLMRAMRHGVRPGPWMDALDLPRNIGIMRPDGRARAGWRRVRRLLPWRPGARRT